MHLSCYHDIIFKALSYYVERLNENERSRNIINNSIENVNLETYTSETIKNTDTCLQLRRKLNLTILRKFTKIISVWVYLNIDIS